MDSQVKNLVTSKPSSGFPSQVSVILAPNQYLSQVSVLSFHLLLRGRTDMLDYSHFTLKCMGSVGNMSKITQYLVVRTDRWTEEFIWSLNSYL